LIIVEPILQKIIDGIFAGGRAKPARQKRGTSEK